VVHMEIPRNAPAVASKEAFVHASPEDVWTVLSDLEKWPQWNESVKTMEVRGPVAPGTEFRWVAGRTKITSRLEEVDPPHRIVWSGTTMGIRAVHIWELTADDTSTKVSTQESFQGLIVRLFARRMGRSLERALAQSVEALKREVER
jgi:hypothetical protein